MSKITAKDAREIMAKSDSYKATLLSKIFNEVKAQAEKGLNWAHISFDVNDSQVIIEQITDELVIIGYSVNDKRARQKTITC
jgi:predicted transcriptional regulator